MVAVCCVYGCSEKFVKCGTVTFHRFPKDKVRRRMWELQMRRKDFTATDNMKVCSKHFTPECFHTEKFGGTWLKFDAIPTIFNFPEHVHKEVTFGKPHELKSFNDEEGPSTGDFKKEKRKYCLGDFNEDDMTSSAKVGKVLRITQEAASAYQWKVKALNQKTLTCKRRKSKDLDEIENESLISDSSLEASEMFESSNNEAESGVIDISDIPELFIDESPESGVESIESLDAVIKVGTENDQEEDTVIKVETENDQEEDVVIKAEAENDQEEEIFKSCDHQFPGVSEEVVPPHENKEAAALNRSTLASISGTGGFLRCLSIRIGSYKALHQKEKTTYFDVSISKDGFSVNVPMTTDVNKNVTVDIRLYDITQMFVYFGSRPRQGPFIFISTTAEFAEDLRGSLDMQYGDYLYFDPNSNNEKEKMISLLMDAPLPENQLKFLRESILQKVKVTELDFQTANTMLVKSTPDERPSYSKMRDFQKETKNHNQGTTILQSPSLQQDMSITRNVTVPPSKPELEWNNQGSTPEPSQGRGCWWLQNTWNRTSRNITVQHCQPPSH